MIQFTKSFTMSESGVPMSPPESRPEVPRTRNRPPLHVDERFIHPWMRQISAKKTFWYNLAHKTTVAGLVAFTCYGAFEVARGTYFVVTAARKIANDRAILTAGVSMSILCTVLHSLPDVIQKVVPLNSDLSLTLHTELDILCSCICDHVGWY